MFANRRRDPISIQRAPRPHAAGAKLVGRWWAVMRHPQLRTFDRQQALASWHAVWQSLCLLAVVEALEVAYVVYGPEHAAGYWSLPLGPKLQLPQTPLLPLAALVGSVAQFFVFAGLLHLSARLLGGRGAFPTQAYLLALGWVPLMGLSDIVELLPMVGAWLGLLLRVYTLFCCVLALASAQRLTLARAWTALLVPALVGLLLGPVMLAVLSPLLSRFLA